MELIYEISSHPMLRTRKLIVANWKMNMTYSSACAFLRNFINVSSQHDVVFCVPFVYIKSLSDIFPELVFGAQDCSAYEHGSYTGDISACMLYSVGCRYVILGHNERRKYHHENDHDVLQKINAAKQNSLLPIICIDDQCAAGIRLDALVDTLKSQCDMLLQDIAHPIVAYEPSWAIGSGNTPSVQDIEFISKSLKALYPNLQFLYGGSVNENNADKILSSDFIDGTLIGSASLSAEKFRKIIDIT